MRILLALATSTGGVGTHVAMLADGLRRRGHQVVVAAPAATGERFGFPASGPFVPLEIANQLRPWHDLRAARTLRRWAARADVVHAHGIRAGAIAAVALAGAGRRGGSPILVVTWHNAVLGSDRRSRLARLFERAVLRRADLALAVSSDLSASLGALRGAPVLRAVVVAAVEPAARSAAEVRTELELADGVRLVLAVGRLHPQKGFDVLVGAAGLDTTSRSTVYAIAGDGPARADLEAAIQARATGSGEPARVRLLGHRADVADLLAAADVVVMPSRWEGWPLVAGQVLAAGRPFIATAVGGIPELVGDAALLIAPDDPTELATAITRVLDHGEVAEKLIAAARARSAQLPSVDDVTTDVIDVYRRTLAQRRQHSRTGR